MQILDRQICHCDCGENGLLKLKAAVAMMMDCCQFQEYAETKFCDFLRKTDTAVFLASLQMNIFRFPAFREKVRVKVVIYDGYSIYGYRRLTIRDEKGELCMIANGIGCFFNFKTAKAVKLPDNIGELITFEEAEPMDALPRKIPLPVCPGTIAGKVEITASMLDLNGHLVSPEYFSIAQDRLPEDFHFDRVRIEYKQQVKKGTLLEVYLHRTDEKTFVAALRSSEGKVLHALVEFSRA